MFKNVFLTPIFYSRGFQTSRGDLRPPTLPLDGPMCVNNALINALKISASIATLVIMHFVQNFKWLTHVKQQKHNKVVFGTIQQHMNS